MTASSAVSLGLAALVCAYVAGCGGSGSHGSRSASIETPTNRASTTIGATASNAAPLRSNTTTNAARQPRRHHRSPGSLPQTRRLPDAHTRTFATEMAALWAGVRTGSLPAALPAFFPEAAYVQVKAIADPRTDYANRLLNEYGRDLGAAHALLAAHAQSATLLAVNVPTAYTHWVDPGACYNRVGYYEVPNSRLVYREDGRVRSFGIASMISWRGVWYVVHMGAVSRPSEQGVVDDPSAGRGSSAASATC